MIILLGLLIFRQTNSTVTLAGTKINVEVVSREADLERGLSGRSRLAPNAGMLFIFPHPDRWGIWMKEMNFAIDIIWLDQNWQVIYIAPNISPATYPEVYTPPIPASYVLELPAGWAGSHDLRVGDSAIVPSL